MADPQSTCVIVCESIHDVMALERALKDAQVAVEMVPTPRELTSDCGMALVVQSADFERITELKCGDQLRWRGIYSPEPGGYSQIA